MSAAAGDGAVGPRAVASDGERFAAARWLTGDTHWIDRRTPDHERRQIPHLVRLANSGRRHEAAGKTHFDFSHSIADDMPVGDHEAAIFAHIDQCAAAMGFGVSLLRDDAHDSRMRQRIEWQAIERSAEKRSSGG